MDPLRILEKAEKRFTLEHLRRDEVEAVSVLTVEELDALITAQVKERTGQLAGELKHVRTRLQELEAEQRQAGGLERAAAEAALDAEAHALEAKAAAELRAEQAEVRARELEAKLAERGDPAPSVATTASVAADAGEVDRLKARVVELEAEVIQARLGGGGATEGGDVGDGAPVTPDDHKRARRLVDALLDDVVGEDEERARAALGRRTFRIEFARELETARRQYVKRVRTSVRGEQDHWKDAIDAREKR